jgi:hypothetical protein
LSSQKFLFGDLTVYFSFQSVNVRGGDIDNRKKLVYYLELFNNQEICNFSVNILCLKGEAMEPEKKKSTFCIVTAKEIVDTGLLSFGFLISSGLDRAQH